MPPAGLEPALQPPEGCTLSTELWGLLVESISLLLFLDEITHLFLGPFILAS